MTPEPLQARAKALHLHGLLAHWPEAVWGAFWLDAARVQLGRGELPRADQQDGGSRSPAAALCRGQPHVVARRGAVVSAQSLGGAPCTAPRDPQGRVALARKLAVVLHAMWSAGQVFQWRRSEASPST
jgi:hypothetical protein